LQNTSSIQLRPTTTKDGLSQAKYEEWTSFLTKKRLEKNYKRREIIKAPEQEDLTTKNESPLKPKKNSQAMLHLAFEIVNNRLWTIVTS